MYGVDHITAVLIILAVMLVMLFAVAALIIIDHKARIQELRDEAAGFSEIRRNHPRFSFLITSVLFMIILALFFELAVTLVARTGLFQTESQQQAPSWLIKKKPELRFTEKKRHFHNVPKVNFVTLGKKAVCLYCHGDYPHFTLPMIRALLNMHTQFIG